VLDEEVGALSEAVVKLKGMATAIGEESRETGKAQDAVAKQLEAAQVRVAPLLSGRCTRVSFNLCRHMQACELLARPTLARIRA
jgi:hypothetical protein